MEVVGSVLVGVALAVGASLLWSIPAADNGFVPAPGRLGRTFEQLRPPGRRVLLGFLLAALPAAFCTTVRTSVACLAAGVSVTWYVVWWFENRGRSRRLAVIREQLPPVLTTVACALEAGQTVTQALQLAAASLSPPLGEELAQTVRELELGVPLEEALASLRRRTGIDELELVACGLTMHQQVGADLRPFFDLLTKLSAARASVRQELWAGGAAPRLSAAVLVLLPWVFALLVYGVTALITGGQVEPYTRPLTKTTLGHFYLGTAVILQVIGAWICVRLTRVEV